MTCCNWNEAHKYAGPSPGKATIQQTNMTEHSSSEHTRHTETEARYSVRRYYQRSDEPRPWWPHGILPLLLLGLLFLAGLFLIAPDMQERTESNVASVLHNAGYTQLDVEADGQRINIKGTANPDDLDLIKRIAQGTTCDTFIAKGLVCPTAVDVDLETETRAEYHNFSFVRSANGLILRGEVPGQDMHELVLDRAQAKFETVIDSLQVVSRGVDAGYDWATGKALVLLDGVNTGKITWENAELSFAARTVQENEQHIRTLFGSARFPERMGTLDLQFEEEVDQCNVRLEGALSETMIFFETASAVISDGSKKQLALIADIAKNCPGDLVVEGHTDNVGDDNSNLDLSKRRANSVVTALTQLGVNARRLSAIGYGETRPVMANETPQGRAMNRRIAIQVADFN